MIELTHSTSVDTGSLVLTIFMDGRAWIRQPFNPITGQAWESEEQAQAWAEECCAGYIAATEEAIANPPVGP